jgi:hypothetical protein
MANNLGRPGAERRQERRRSRTRKIASTTTQVIDLIGVVNISLLSGELQPFQQGLKERFSSLGDPLYETTSITAQLLVSLITNYISAGFQEESRHANNQTCSLNDSEEERKLGYQ